MTWRESAEPLIVATLFLVVLLLGLAVTFQVGREYERGQAAELYINLDSATQAYTAINGLMDALERDQRTCHDQLARFLVSAPRGGVLRAR